MPEYQDPELKVYIPNLAARTDVPVADCKRILRGLAVKKLDHTTGGRVRPVRSLEGGNIDISQNRLDQLVKAYHSIGQNIAQGDYGPALRIAKANATGSTENALPSAFLETTAETAFEDTLRGEYKDLGLALRWLKTDFYPVAQEGRKAAAKRLVNAHMDDDDYYSMVRAARSLGEDFGYDDDQIKLLKVEAINRLAVWLSESEALDGADVNLVKRLAEELGRDRFIHPLSVQLGNYSRSMAAHNRTGTDRRRDMAHWTSKDRELRIR